MLFSLVLWIPTDPRIFFGFFVISDLGLFVGYSTVILLASSCAVVFFVGLFYGSFVGFFVRVRLICRFIQRLFRWLLCLTSDYLSVSSTVLKIDVDRKSVYL